MSAAVILAAISAQPGLLVWLGARSRPTLRSLVEVSLGRIDATLGVVTARFVATAKQSRCSAHRLAWAREAGLFMPQVVAGVVVHCCMHRTRRLALLGREDRDRFIRVAKKHSRATAQSTLAAEARAVFREVMQAAHKRDHSHG